MKKKIFRIVIFTTAGSFLGFAYYYFVGCRSGSCPISSNPYISSIYGSILGLLYGFNIKSKNNKKIHNS